MTNSGILVPLNEKEWPNSFLARSSPSDVARVESRTFICSPTKEEAGPLNIWADPTEMKATLKKLFTGASSGRTLYVLPFCMGPVGSPLSYYGIQLTDSPLVVANMMIMTRVGSGAMKEIEKTNDFVPCLHTVGKPLSPGEADDPWPCNETKYICHFPHTREIISFGSAYGGNAILGKKCLGLRISSVLSRDHGDRLSEHMALLSLTSPQGKKKVFAAAFPSQCGKTNFAAMSNDAMKKSGWEIKIIGDDLAFLRVNHATNRIMATNPESGTFGVAPGTNTKTNAAIMQAIRSNSLFVNVGIDKDGNPWWEGLTKEPPSVDRNMISWLRKPWRPDIHSGKELVAQANSRFTAPMTQFPNLDPEWDTIEGLPVDGFIFGGRRSNTIPLIYQSLSWNHGVYIGSTLQSLQTSAVAEAKEGLLRFDPFAMRPFIGYNAAAYFAHWIRIGKMIPSQFQPKIFHVNFFRRDSNNQYVWPGFGENARLLQWMFDQCDSTPGHSSSAIETPIGYMPKLDRAPYLNVIPSDKLATILEVNKEEYLRELEQGKKFLVETFGSTVPSELLQVNDEIKQRLLTSKKI
jgi:phosphoenolpyruvate carboxykinase (GTP)